ncbi:S1 family peptidase [Amycolatopsis dendrobii]|uniref:Serine protease n=1 Tax=Amycolatopsis dendrobii TaxID=2760662 RepID=A0A7W3Z9M0_9PSEU|nr:serine protease [Amycolatopsis dendrobii]MBB1153536.1 serine protease [Amycolatopsis dendrobii]
MATASMTSTASAADSSAQLIGGQLAPASVKSVGALMFDAAPEGLRDAQTCGSVVVDDRWLLTAAQCVTDLGIPDEIPAKHKKFHVRVGLDRTQGGATGRVERIFVNPQWNPNTPTGDLALLQVDNDLDVPAARLAWWSPRPGDVLRTYGWGATEPLSKPDRSKLPKLLHQLDLPVVPKQQCADAGISHGEFCTGHPNAKGPAYGDAGGPAVTIDKRGRMRVVGIDSRGGSPVPGQSNTAFTDISSYRNWIEDTIAENS